MPIIDPHPHRLVQADLNALVDGFAVQLQMVSVTDGEASSSVADVEESPGVPERLLDNYNRLGVADCVPSAVEVTEPMDAVPMMGVHWVLQRADRAPEDASCPAGALTDLRSGAAAA